MFTFFFSIRLFSASLLQQSDKFLPVASQCDLRRCAQDDNVASGLYSIPLRSSLSSYLDAL